ncbi:MAG: O-antigen ligase family protein [Rhodospirillaceae bacterium]|nr:O-antigen ligase family protein [Rhodospirillaceae bacterium]
MSTLQRQLLYFVEQVYFIIGLMLVAKSLSFLLNDLSTLGSYTVEEAIEGNQRFQAMAGLYYGIALVYLLANSDKAFLLIRRNYWVFLFIGYVFLSTLWADLPGVALRRSIALFGTTAFALHVVMRRSRAEFLAMVAQAMAAVVIVNLMFIAALPGIGIEYARAGEWRGILSHKNTFGTTMGLAALVFAVQRRTGLLYRVFYLGMTAVALFCVFKSGSRSAWLMTMGVFVVGMPFLAALQSARLSVPTRVVLLAVFGVGGVGLAIGSFLQVGLAAIGRDITLTDRTIIWDLVVDLGLQRPLLGYGFGSFWQGSAGEAMADLFASLGHSHNGYIDLWLQLGFVGVGVFVPSLVAMVRRLFRESIRYRGPNVTFFPLFLMMIMIHNTIALSFPEHSSIIWVIFVAGMAYTALPYPDCFRRRSPQPIGGVAGVPAMRVPATPPRLLDRPVQ